MRTVRAIIISASVLLCLGVAIAGDEDKPLELEHADQLLSSSDGEIVNLVGNVHLSHEGIDLYSRKATWYRKTGLVNFVDSVKVIDDRRTITAGSMTYYRRDRRMSARNGVTIEDTAEDMLLRCEEAEYYRRSRQFEAVGSPVLIFHPHDDSLKMEIKARRMEYFAEGKEGVAYDSVVITQKEMTAVSGTARFTREPEGAVLTDDPVVYFEDNRLAGDSISIFTEDRTMDRLLARGNAGAFYMIQPDTLYEEFTTADLTGRELEAFFEGDKIQKAIMRGNAVSIYTPAITDTLTRGINTASGDSITMHFENGYIRKVFISGGAQGEYIEPRFEPDEEKPHYDSTIYFGSEIDYNFEDSEIKLFDNGELRYQDMILNAGDIRFKINTKILVAEGLKSDSTEEETQLPVLLQGTDRLDGRRMTYNLDTKKGQVVMARTKFENGFYVGEKIRQVSDDVLFVSSGNYTSCDRQEDTHYHFHSDRMKMVGKDKVVAKPVILYIGDLPVFALPYYVFPVRKGRHSGFLTFEIGNFERGERFIRNLGYYWAASDYWDLETSLDFYENVKSILNTRVNYNLRYRLSGGVGMRYSRQTGWKGFSKTVSNSWMINFNHSHEISRTAKIRGSGSFVSNKSFIEDNVYDQYDRLDRTVKANANFTKRWESSSLVISSDQSWNLDTDVKQMRLPSVSFTMPSFQLFPDPTKSRNKERVKPWEEIEEPKRRFYNSINLSLSSSAVNFKRRIKNPDSSYYWKDFQTIHTSSSIKSPQKILGILTVTPGINFAHTAYHVEWNRLVDSLGLETDRVFTRYTYNLSLASNTSIYGTVYPNILGVAGLRHVITPSVSYRFIPEIEKNEEYRSYTGAGSASRRSKTISYSLGNLFQAKYLSGETESKMDLFSLNFNGSYDFVKEEKKIGDLRASLRTAAVPYINLDYNSIYSFYNFDDSRRELSNPRLVSSTFSASINGKVGSGGGSGRESRRGGRGFPGANERREQAPETEFKGAGLNYNLSYRYTVSRTSLTTVKTQWLDFALGLQPTEKWTIFYRSHYDIKEKRSSSQTVEIGRNMHCWEGKFIWVPSGPIAGYYVRINIKSLPDIKLEKSEGGVRDY
ncbi:MAG: putative LPS assembly protein LptD [candidate division Zixibacteria bacterium]